MRLLEQITERENLPIIILIGDKSYTKAELLSWAASYETRIWLERLSDKSIGISTGNNGLLAVLLIFLDGIAKRLTLLPPELNSETVRHIASNAEVEILISDRANAHDLGLPLAPGLPSYSKDSAPDCIQTESINTEWVISTSGTTKTPKLVAHSVASLARSVKKNPKSGSEIKWGLLYDLNRFAGLQVFLQALLGGSTLVVPPQATALEELLQIFTANRCNALSATPTLWRKILMTPRFERQVLKQITLGGEIADQTILTALKSSFPNARIRHIYASTEAGVGFSVSDGREGFPSSYLSKPPPDIELRISVEGILEIKPSTSDQRYLGENFELLGDDGFVTTGDRVKVISDRVFFHGRDSGAINVGGNKVQPEKVENVLLEHRSIAMATVSAKHSGIIGALVEAKVVLHVDSDSSETNVAEIRNWCAARLERHEVPAIIRIVDDIPTNATGKILRGG